MFKIFKRIGKKIRFSSIELKIIMIAAVIIIILQLIFFSRKQVVVVVDEETGKTDLVTRGSLPKEFIKQKIRNLSDEDKTWLKKEFGYDK